MILDFYFILSLKLYYLLLKPLISVILMTLANFIIPYFFFAKNSFSYVSFLIFLLLIFYILLGFFFIEYFWMAYSNEFTNEYVFLLYEKIKLSNKILISLLIEFSYFDSTLFNFLSVLITLNLLAQFGYYYFLFIQGNENNLIDFYLTNFLTSLLITRLINLIGDYYYPDEILQSSDYNILLILLNVSIFLLITTHIKSKMRSNLKNCIFKNLMSN